VLIEYFKEKQAELPHLSVVSPDAGGVERARAFAKRLDAPLAIIDKRRSGHNVAESLTVIGEVAGRTAILIDDMIDTGGTIVKASEALFDNGARDVIVAATHAILSGPAVERFANSRVSEVVVTDTLPIPEDRRFDQLTVLPVAPLIARAIQEVFTDGSVTSMFEGDRV